MCIYMNSANEERGRIMKKILFFSLLLLGLIFISSNFNNVLFAEDGWMDEDWEISLYEFPVYTDVSSSDNHFIPSGWMGDYSDVSLNENWRENPHSGETCKIKIYHIFLVDFVG